MNRVRRRRPKKDEAATADAAENLTEDPATAE